MTKMIMMILRRPVEENHITINNSIKKNNEFSRIRGCMWRRGGRELLRSPVSPGRTRRAPYPVNGKTIYKRDNRTDIPATNKGSDHYSITTRSTKSDHQDSKVVMGHYTATLTQGGMTAALSRFVAARVHDSTVRVLVPLLTLFPVSMIFANHTSRVMKCMFQIHVPLLHNMLCTKKLICEEKKNIAQ